MASYEVVQTTTGVVLRLSLEEAKELHKVLGGTSGAYVVYSVLTDALKA